MTLARNSLAIACALALAAPIFAQTVPDLPPPERVRVDENGVDLARGTFTGTRTDVAIGGEGRSGLALVRRFGYTVNVSSWDLGLFVQGSTTTASLGLTSVPFTQSGSTYTAADGSGATLVKNGSAWVLTTGDGTVVTYDYLTHDTGDFNRKARATSILYPSGERITLTWAATSYCTNFSDNCQTGTWIDAVRLQAVSTSMGYQLHYNYARDNQPIGTNQGQAWRRLEQVVAINTTVEPCDPAAGHCTLANSWPTVSYSGNNVTDPEQRTSSYVVDPSAQTFSIRRPSAASPNLVYQHAVVGNEIVVTQVTRDGLVWSYNRTVNGNTATMVVTEPGNRTRTIVSDLAVGLPTAFTNELGKTWSYQYDSEGRLRRITAPEGNFVQYSYDSRGNVTEMRMRDKTGNGANDIVATATYPASCANPRTCNQPSSTTDAGQNTTDYTYHPTHGGVLTVTAPAPIPNAVRPQVRFTYSALAQPGGGTVHRLTQVSQCQTLASCADQADETRTTIAYDQANLEPTRVTAASGNGALSATSMIGYDIYARPITVDGPLASTNDTTRTRYNMAGYTFTAPVQGPIRNPLNRNSGTITFPAGRNDVGWYHVHAVGGGRQLSGEDVQMLRSLIRITRNSAFVSVLGTDWGGGERGAFSWRGTEGTEFEGREEGSLTCP